MKLLRLSLVLMGLASGQALAGPLAISSPLVEAEKTKHPKFDFRLVEDRISDPTPFHNSGMIVRKSIAPNATLGIGLFKMSPKKLGSGDFRSDGRASGSRKAAASFVFKF